MALNYDFDIFSLEPPAAPAGAASRVLARLGLAPRSARRAPDRDEAEPKRIALFRDARTADALGRAPDGLSRYFMTAGFGLQTYASGAPRHRYPAGDEGVRLQIIERLTALAPCHVLPGPGDYPESGDVFRLGEFLAELAEARPDYAADQGSAQVTVRAQKPDGDIALAAVCARDATPAFAPVRRLWLGRGLLTVVGIGVSVLVLKLASAFDAINLASL